MTPLFSEQELADLATPYPDRIIRHIKRREIDRAQILEVLEDCQWKIKGVGNAAERLGLKPSTLRYRMKVLGIKRPALAEKQDADNVQELLAAN